MGETKGTWRAVQGISMPPAFLDRVRTQAKAEGQTISGMVREALRQYLGDPTIAGDDRGMSVSEVTDGQS